MLRLQLTLAVVVFAGCSDNLSTIGQRITCTTDPDTDVVLSCQPGEGDGSPNTCDDIDEDGDGAPSDDGVVQAALPGADADAGDGDDDDDGIDDADDCDEHDGEDDDEPDLPYDIKLSLGQVTTPIADAFAEKGEVPEIVSVEMDGGGTWRLVELQAGTEFTVTQDDCDHDGNRDVGRDRVLVTWRVASGDTDTDHLDLRYCEP